MIGHLQKKAPPVWKRFTRDEVQEVIWKCDGVQTIICNLLDCTFSQLAQALEKMDLKDELEQAKAVLVSKAERVVSRALESDNEKLRLDAAQFVLKARAGWSERKPVAVQVSQGGFDLKAVFGI